MNSGSAVKKCLVTGGAGFLGSHLCERLLEAGHQVLCLDNLHTSSISNIAEINEHPGFTFVEHDVAEPFEAEVDEIYNLACPASPVHYQNDPVKTVRTNVLGAINLLELARQTGARILQASTSEVYGDPAVTPQAEDYWGNVNPIGPRACYDEGKRCAETLFFDYARQHGVEIKVARIFNTYGPRMAPDDGRVVSNFLVQALQNQDLTVYGAGDQTRSFCYVDDLIEGLLALMSSPADLRGPVNLGNPNEFTIRELADSIISLTKSHCRIRFEPLPQDDPQQRRPDVSLARETLNWEPKVQLEEGLTLTCRYFSDLLRV